MNLTLTEGNGSEHSETPLAELVRMTAPFGQSWEEETSDCRRRFTEPEAVLIPVAELL